MPKGEAFQRLVEVMDRLLAPDGCPWDREQTLASLKPYLIEETYEVLDALEGGTADDHCEELGDLLMQIVFQAALREKEKAFDVDDVARGIADKLVRRHPHVFGDARLETAEQVLAKWQELKAKEKKRRVLDGVPRAMPALARAQKISERAADVGFDWPDVEGTKRKVREELDEIEAAGTDAERAHEIGDLLFAIVSLARKLGVDAEAALRATTDKFVKRFEFIEDALAENGSSPRESTLEEMDALWERAKREGHGGVTEK